MDDKDCLFCRKLAAIHQLPAGDLVGEFRHGIALLGPWQYYHGYCLLVSRRHATELSQLPADERRGFLDEMCLLAKAVEDVCRPHKLNYELLGNQVPHLHWHLFPRYRTDPEALRPVWLTLDRAERDEAERKRLQTGPQDRLRTAALLRERIKALVAVKDVPSP